MMSLGWEFFLEECWPRKKGRWCHIKKADGDGWRLRGPDCHVCETRTAKVYQKTIAAWEGGGGLFPSVVREYMTRPSELFQSDKFIPVVPSHPARANLFQQH